MESWIKVPKERCNGADVSSIPGRGIRVKEKILATPSVGAWSERLIHRYKRSYWASKITIKMPHPLYCHVYSSNCWQSIFSSCRRSRNTTMYEPSPVASSGPLSSSAPGNKLRTSSSNYSLVKSCESVYTSNVNTCPVIIWTMDAKLTQGIASRGDPVHFQIVLL